MLCHRDMSKYPTTSLHARCDSPVGFLSSPGPFLEEQTNLPMYIRANAASDSPHAGHIELDMCVSARSIGGGVR
jgi:hypothetical protein